MRRELIVSIVVATAADAETKIPIFVTVEIPAHVYDGGWEHFVGGGVAVFDCNGDELPELFVAGGSNRSQLFKNTSSDKISFTIDTPDELSQSTC